VLAFARAAESLSPWARSFGFCADKTQTYTIAFADSTRANCSSAGELPNYLITVVDFFGTLPDCRTEGVKRELCGGSHVLTRRRSVQAIQMSEKQRAKLQEALGRNKGNVGMSKEITRKMELVDKHMADLRADERLIQKRQVLLTTSHTHITH
jgi:hypothetical protein